MFPFSLFSGLSIKLILILGLIAGIVGTTTGMYFSIRHAGAVEQQLKDQKAEYERVIKDQTTIIQNQQDILDQNELSTSDLNKQIETLQNKFKTLGDFLDSDEARKEDKAASELLKQIIEKLAKESEEQP